MKPDLATIVTTFLLISTIVNAESVSKVSKFIGYYGIDLGIEKGKVPEQLSKLSIHYLNRAENMKVLGQNKLATVIFQHKDVCADDLKDLGKGYELVICTFTSEKAKAQKIKGMALVFAGGKLFRIESNLDGKSTKELEQLMKDATPREKEKLNTIGKTNKLFSFFPFLYSEKADPASQRIFQKGQQVFSVVNDGEATYVVLLEPTILYEHQNKNK